MVPVTNNVTDDGDDENVGSSRFSASNLRQAPTPPQRRKKTSQWPRADGFEVRINHQLIKKTFLLRIINYIKITSFLKAIMKRAF